MRLVAQGRAHQCITVTMRMSLHAGEEGVDQGGVTKEFFQLLTKAIFNEVSHWPCHGLQGPVQH